MRVLSLLIISCLLIISLMYNLSSNVSDQTDKDSSNKFDLICIKNHQYYIRSAYQVGYLAIRLDDNGNPIKCEENL